MNNENQIKVGLWEKISAQGNKYFNGKATIDGKEYWVKMFDNSSKTNPKAPDFNILLDEVVEQEFMPKTTNESTGW